MNEKVVLPLSIFKDEYCKNNYNENMFREDGFLNPKYNSSKKTGTIASIFEDYWDSVYSKTKI